jgi:hypothetical protein
MCRRDIESYLIARGWAFSHLIRWEIPAAEAFTALFELSQMNLTPSTLFPDLGGAAVDANSQGIWDSWLGSFSPTRGVLPSIAYGRGCSPGQLVMAVTSRGAIAIASVTNAGEWTMQISPTHPLHPNLGEDVYFFVDGQATGSRMAWVPGMIPPDIYSGFPIVVPVDPLPAGPLSDAIGRVDSRIEFVGSPPSTAGHWLFRFSGGSLAELLEASGCDPATAFFYHSKPDGSFVRWIPAADVSTVNTAAIDLFGNGIPPGTLFIERFQ